MKIRRLNILRMPGFESGGPELEDLGDGLNLVAGPNGSGKTTICRAIRGLLWPNTLSRFSPVALESNWTDDDASIYIELEGDRHLSQKDGGTMDSLPVPPAEFARCYTVTIDDLFDDTDADLARRIVTAMAGGYDLGSLRSGTLLQLKSNHGKSAASDLRKARQHVKSLSGRQEELREREQQIESLEKEKDDARSARKEIERLGDVRDLASLKDDVVAAEGALAAFPVGMDRLVGDEADRLAGIDSDVEKARGDLEEAEEETRQAKQDLDDAALPEEGIHRTTIDQQKGQLADVDEVERSLALAEQELAKATAASEALGRLGNADADKLAAMDLAGLDEIDRWHEEQGENRSSLQACHAELELLGEEETHASDAETLTRAIGLLREWLEIPRSPASAGLRNATLGTVLAGLALLCSLVLTLVHHVAWLVVALLSVVIAAALWLLHKGPGVDTASTLRDRYGRLRVGPPKSWNKDEVGHRLTDLEKELSAVRESKQKSIRMQRLRGRESPLVSKAEELAAQRNELIGRLGVAPESTATSLVLFVAKLKAFQQAHQAEVEQSALRDKLAERRKKLLCELNVFLASFNAPDCESAVSARAQCEHLFDRAEKHRIAADALPKARRQSKRVQERLKELDERRRKLFESVGLESGDEAGLADRLGRMPSYRKAVEALNGGRIRRDALATKLADAPELTSLSPDEIDAHKETLEQQAGEYEELIEELKDIRDEVDKANRENALAQALASAKSAEDELADCLAQAELAAAGSLLLDDLEKEYELASRPAVLKQADDWFRRFTVGRYELRATRGASGPAFAATDSVSGKTLELDSLSRGTRMQLLMAVRLAFAASEETAGPLPFVLDEVLSSTDPERFRAVAECLLALVKAGRQVFYFTCQPGDAKAWQQVAGDDSAQHVRWFDLYEIRRLGQRESTLLSDATVPQRTVPPPDGRTLQEYAGALKVPALDATKGSGGAHVANFAETADELYQLMAVGIETWGQLASLSVAASDAYVANERLRAMRVRATALDAFAEAYQIGRGKPVTREALEDAGVTPAFIDRIAELARGINGDATTLLDAITQGSDPRAKGFRTATLDKVKDNLTEMGYLDPEPALSAEQLRSRVLAAVSDAVRNGTVPAEVVGGWIDRFLQDAGMED